MRWILALIFWWVAPGVSYAQYQAAPQDAFASLALDYCAPVVGLGPSSIERIATERGLGLGDWRTAEQATGAFEQWIRRAMRGSEGKRIRFVFAPGASEGLGPAAIVDEDARSCLVTGLGIAQADATLLTRLMAGENGWQYVTTVESNGGSIFEWPGPEGGSSSSLLHWPSQPNDVTRVLVQRRDLRVEPLVPPEVTAAWVAHVVDTCAAAVHRRRDLTQDDFAPFLVFKEVSDRSGGLVFDSAPGQPNATVIANLDSGRCLITGAGAHARAIDAAILALAAERGLPPSERPRRLRTPKFLIAVGEDIRRGRDAYVSSAVIMGILMATVGDATR